VTSLLTRASLPTTADRDRRLLSLVAATAAGVAAVVHALVVPEHLDEARAAGVFFAVLAGAQLALVVILLRPLRPWVLAAALVGHVGVVVLYIASRTMDLAFLPAHRVDHLPVADGVGNGVPLLPGAHTEPVGVLDLACLAAELVLIIALAALLPVRARRWLGDGLAALAVLGLVARGLGLLG
jgi:hypothetical protein